MPVFRKTKHEVVAEFRSLEILDAARRIFGQKGFEGASVDEIAEAAGLAKGTVYTYFHSKRDLYRAALQHGLAGLIAETRRNVDAAPTTAEKIRAFVATRIRYPGFGLVSPPCLEKGFKNLCRQQIQLLEDVIAEGAARGDLRPVPPGSAAFLVCEMAASLIGRRRLGWSRGTSEKDIELLFDLIWKGLAELSVRTSPGEAPCTVH